MTSSGPGPDRNATASLGSPPAHPPTALFADGGFWGRQYASCIELIDINLITPARHKLNQRPPGEIAQGGTRLVIESVFAALKRKMSLQDHLAKSLPGLVARIAQRLLALTLGIYLNLLSGRAPRAPGAYDER